MLSSFLILFAGMAVVLGCILVWRLPAFLALIGAAWMTAALTSDTALGTYAASQGWNEAETASFIGQASIKRVASELAETFGKVGIIIAMASIIGKCLLASGGAAGHSRQQAGPWRVR